MLIPAVFNLLFAISPLWSRNAVSLHSYFPSKSLCWAELFLIALICCVLGWEKLIQSDRVCLCPTSWQHRAPSCTIPLHLVLHVWRMDAQCLTQSHQAAYSKVRMLPTTWLAFAHGSKGNKEASQWPISDVSTYIPDGPSVEEQRLGEMLSQLGDRIAKWRGAREEGLSFLCVCVLTWTQPAGGFWIEPLG